MIDASNDYYPHLLLTYIDIKVKKISIRGILSQDNRTVIKTLGDKAFKVPKGNSRGIEYSGAAMKLLMERAYFSIDIDDADLTIGTNPIERRRQLLRDMGFMQTPTA
jgi:hypothetical protein